MQRFPEKPNAQYRRGHHTNDRPYEGPLAVGGRHGAAQKTPISAVAAAGKNQVHFSVSTPMAVHGEEEGAWRHVKSGDTNEAAYNASKIPYGQPSPYGQPPN